MFQQHLPLSFVISGRRCGGAHSCWEKTLGVGIRVILISREQSLYCRMLFIIQVTSLLALRAEKCRVYNCIALISLDTNCLHAVVNTTENCDTKLNNCENRLVFPHYLENDANLFFAEHIFKIINWCYWLFIKNTNSKSKVWNLLDDNL